jgi:hypothetical protein
MSDALKLFPAHAIISAADLVSTCDRVALAIFPF